MLQNHFYYGIFEYPKNSGQWYNGKHKPIINKELFDQVQSQLKGNILKTRQEKEFAFTKLMVCGLCGSGITADEKYKKLKNGQTNVHIYYGCTKVRDRDCKCGYINETDLLKQLEILITKIGLDEIRVKEKIKLELERFKKFQLMLLGKKDPIQINDIDVRNYTRFLLREGTILEKRELLDSFKGKITIKNKQIYIS